ncbi:MAG: 50S ribosomal protein L25 [Acidobacteria bacterium]|nr:50S ribosomal protein L25 [Acidobacteriota bacterium]
MAVQEVVVKPRTTTGKEESGRIRRQGLIPAVVYGLNGDPVSVCVEPKIMNKVIRSEQGMNTVLKLKMEGSDQERHVMIKEVDRHPVTNRLWHIDFLRIDMDKMVTAIVPIEYDGTPAGVKLGGILTIVRHEIEIECLAKDLPGRIHLDVSGMGLDEALRVSNLPAIKGVTYQLAERRTLAVVHAPEAEAKETEEEDEEEI